MDITNATCAWCHHLVLPDTNHGENICTPRIAVGSAFAALAHLFPTALAAAVRREATLAKLSGLVGRPLTLNEHGAVSLTAAEVERLKDQMPPPTPPSARLDLHWLDGIPIHLAAPTAQDEPQRVLCPECRAGKHTVCAGFAFDANDDEIDCQCKECTP